MAATLVSIVRGAGVEPRRADAASSGAEGRHHQRWEQKPGQKLNRTTVTENELNAYLAYEAKDQMPVGLVEPAVSIVERGRITARAIIDLDAVRKQASDGRALDATSYLSAAACPSQRLDCFARATVSAGSSSNRQVSRPFPYPSRSCRTSSATTRAR